ncbi:MAG: hypothetical protein AAGF89_10100 [Bacteroidota bacterium]
MIYRIYLSLLLVCGLTTFASAQGSNPCADLAKKHLKMLDQHLDIDYGQMKCLKEVAVRFCDANKGNPPTNDAQRDNRRKKLRSALLDCLNARQQAKVKTYYRNQRDKKARRDILQAFIEEFGDEVIIIKKRS